MTSGRTARGLAVAVLALAAAACLPARFSGYEPSGPGRREAGYCVAGIRDNLLVEAPGGVGVHWRAARDDTTRAILLEVYLTVPAGVTVRLQGRELELRSAAWPQPRRLTVEAISAPGPRTFQPDAALAGSDESSRGHFSLWFLPMAGAAWGQTGVPATQRFEARLPPLEIDGRTWESAPVSFAEYTRWGIYTCLQ